jgi:two-component system, OmpR family, phosphate regulon response regulator PhoB
MSLIFVVDDDPDVRELVEYKLLQQGFDVQSASDGQEALREVPGAMASLLLLDVMMPGLSGFDVLARLRTAAATRALPIIMLTAKAEPADVERGLALGANDYMIKPFSPRELMNRIQAQLVPAA